MFFDYGFHALPHRHPPPSCRFFDYGAQADRAILHKALEDVAPRHLLLPRGTAVEREELARHARVTLRDFGTQVALPDASASASAASASAASASAASSAAHTVVVPLPPSFTLFLSDELNATLGLGRMQRWGLVGIGGAGRGREMPTGLHAFIARHHPPPCCILITWAPCCRYALAQLEATVGQADPQHVSERG